MEIISHRGKINKTLSQENNKEAIKNFIDSNITTIEIDIQLTKDNEIILFHDNSIDCIRIVDKDSNELINNYNMILLKDVLQLIKGKRKIYLDIKNEDLNIKQIGIFFEELFNLLEKYRKKYDCKENSIYLCSFHRIYIDYLIQNKIRNNYKYRIGVILYEDNILYFLNNFKDSFNNFDFISIDYNILDSISFCFNKIDIYCYTVNDLKDYNKLIDKNITCGVVSDNPEYFNSL
tara:strand:- start:478 stop:1179 length:702 start_codon:yes stop_codon:yes gene_type:complete